MCRGRVYLSRVNVGLGVLCHPGPEVDSRLFSEIIPENLRDASD